MTELLLYVQIVHVEHLPARQPRFEEPAQPLSAPVQKALTARGVQRLFLHQARALNAVLAGGLLTLLTHARRRKLAPCLHHPCVRLVALPRQYPANVGSAKGNTLLEQKEADVVHVLLRGAGNHVVVCTSTASGKSLCYVLPILEALAADPNATALLMFPTKALAQASKRAAPLTQTSLDSLLCHCPPGEAYCLSIAQFAGHEICLDVSPCCRTSCVRCVSSAAWHLGTRHPPLTSMTVTRPW